MPPFLTIWRHSLCAVTGAIAGGFAGMSFGIAQLQQPALPLTDAIEVGILLGLVAWVFILMVEGLWLHYGSAVVWPSLITSLSSAVLTVVIANAVALPVLSVWIGILFGTVVGALLCRLCGERPGAQGVRR
ncbi:MAG: hypothetical protein JSR59_16910 [Proteobacteria bacterium]|nr:hypothetical protein [Pseudomonadota bacterium]